MGGDASRTRRGALWSLSVGLLIAPAAGADESSALFVPGSRCLPCHNGLLSRVGEDLSLGNDWRSTVMANAARDPYWQAAVRREILDHPESQGAIENECTRCHMPMATVEANLRQKTGVLFPHLRQSRPSDEDRLALDGVSCSLCHQITADRLGQAASFTGRFAIDATTAPGQRKVFGPFLPDAARASVMKSATGYRPVSASHVRQSAVCATCHTLYTQALGPGGQPIGRLPEQVPYLEWLHSDYVSRRTCQACHMPAVEDGSSFTSVLPEPRRGWRRHTFRGGNFLLERILGAHGEALEANVEPAGFERGVHQTVEFLRQQAARVAIGIPAVADGRLEAEVVVTNMGGHKLPTAYPSRRVFIHFTVRNRVGKVVFESGQLEPNGAIAGNDNDRDPARFEPHHRLIERPDEVQVYESVMGDSAGRPTTGLLSGVAYLKDNRLLPFGFVARTAPPDVAVRGDAARDPDFVGGSDRVRYAVPVDPKEAPFRVRAELWLQPVSYRWAHNLAAYRAAEPQRFFGYYRSLSPVSGLMLASAER